MFERPLRALLGLAVLALAGAGAPGAARAEPALPGGFSAVGDIRLGGADGEPSWTEGDFGKVGFGGGRDGEFRLKPRLGQGELIWQPRFGWALSGTVVAGAQRGQEHAVDLIEAYATFKPMPLGATRVSARA